MWFSVEQKPIGSLRDFRRVLETIQKDPYKFTIHGEPMEGTNPSRVRRKNIFFNDMARHLLPLDPDNLPMPSGGVLADPEGAARFAADRLRELVPELEDVSVLAQLSSSAGLAELAEHDPRWKPVAGRGYGAHLWLWLKNPLTIKQQKLLVKHWNNLAWDRWQRPLFDESVHRLVQPFYTAAPVFEGGARDPLPDLRVFLFEGLEDAADLDPPPAEEAPRGASEGRAGRQRRWRVLP